MGLIRGYRLRRRRRQRGQRGAQGRGHHGPRQILLVGSPNVGKSALFNRLTGQYVAVSNYPGTTVEVSKGRSKLVAGHFEVVDTPGMYSLSPITDEERVACRMITTDRLQAVLHIIDAKNIQRMLGLTLQLIEAGLPVILVLNMADEARRLGIEIDVKQLGESLHIPVVETVATTGEGLEALAIEIDEVQPATSRKIDYGDELEAAIGRVCEHLDDGSISKRTRALLLLQEDADELVRSVEAGESRRIADLHDAVALAQVALSHSAHYHATLATRRAVDRALAPAATFPKRGPIGFRERLSRFCMAPATGIPLLILVLYFGLYKFVGGFGAGTVVDFLETSVFEAYINPWFEALFERLLPWETARGLFTGEYGIITLGIRYAVAIVFPIVGTFFLAFSILEDSGYLPRLAMLIDRVFKRIGLNGRAVIPIVLGFGCDTMATMVTRTLETKREKIITAILLSLAVPCSAQIGVILGLLSGHPAALLTWAGVITAVFLLTGTLTAKLLPGQGPSFYMELPPLRVPRLMNVAVKTYSRMVWYFKEVFPLFILASVLIWLGDLTGVFAMTVSAIEPAVNALGLPDEAAKAFLFGFFRRDYGAAGLYDVQKTAALTGRQLAVAAIALTLFLPCIAHFLILRKERGWRLTIITGFGVLIIAFGVGYLVNGALVLLGTEL